VNVLDRHPHRSEGILCQEAHGQTVLLRLDDGSYYALDEVGARVWELCDGRRSLGDVVATLCAEFEAPEQTVRDDVLDFVSQLRGERLLLDAA
jgi:hypothetical protein